MNKKYLKENNLFEAHKQFMRLCEWSYVPKTLEEDGDEEDKPQENMMDNDMPMDNGQDINQIGGDMQAPMDGQDAMDGNMNQDVNQTSDVSMPMGNPQIGMDEPMNNNMPMNEPMMDDENIGEDEEVIDVEDITSAQEKMNDKINVVGQDLGKVSDKIEALMQSISTMEQMINDNNAEIASFKQEFEKRNPTQTEKLNLRSLDSYPFNVSPKEYWEKKGADKNSNYSGYGDNHESTTQEYEITNNDVDDFNDKAIEDSFNIDDDMRQTINKIFNLA